MFCPSCGTKNDDNATFCANCGTGLKGQAPQMNMGSAPSPAGGNEEKGADTIVKILSFCFPIVGAILYFVWKEDKPKAASQVCKMAAIGFGLGIFLYIILMVIGIAAGSM